MKEKIEKFFKEDRTYSGAVKLYNEIGNSLAIKKQLNMQPEEVMKGVLFDQLRILGDITPEQYKLLTTPAPGQPPPGTLQTPKSGTRSKAKKAVVDKGGQSTPKKKNPPKK